MKIYFVLLFGLLTCTTYGQNKYGYIHFNNLTEVKGTEYVIASIDNRSKIADSGSKYLLFIDTKTGSTTQVDIPQDGFVRKIEQVKMDSLKINLILVSAQTVDLDGRKGIDWTDPEQILILSPDGKEKTQITDDRFFTRTWTINRHTGTLVITGHYDTDGNGKYDKEDQNEILIFDLKTLKLKNKI